MFCRLRKRRKIEKLLKIPALLCAAKPLHRIYLRFIWLMAITSGGLWGVVFGRFVIAGVESFNVMLRSN